MNRVKFFSASTLESLEKQINGWFNQKGDDIGKICVSAVQYKDFGLPMFFASVTYFQY